MFTTETDILLFCNNRYIIKEVNSKMIFLYNDINITTNSNNSSRNVWILGRTLNYINCLQSVYFNVFFPGNFLQCIYQ